MIDLAKACRACLNDNTKTISIFNVFNFEEKCYTFAYILEMITEMKVKYSIFSYI